ncbi:MAG TPA: SGNH/GDSL hydrolase family protein [Gammaproteobacteria bacterium]|jgi:phospholipase/lecithinase/hemolysin|nr:SGNH/GDSL hydrolase family protein [Gammaproteobacteria bacterium]
MKYLWLIWVVLSISVHAAPYDKRPINKLIFFGDSLSDKGRLFKEVLDSKIPAPPYYNGRFSNGPVWSELFAAAYDLKQSCHYRIYAIGGATAAYHPEDVSSSPTTLSKEVDDYLFDDYYRYLDKERTLFIFWIGGNDYLLSNADPNMQVAVQRVIDGIMEQIGRLIAYGAQNFMIFNLPDLSVSPYGQSLTPAEQLKLKAVIRIHNEKLASLVTMLRNTDPDLVVDLIDANGLFNNMINNPAFYNQQYHINMTNVKDACWRGSYAGDVQSRNTSSSSASQDANMPMVCPNPDNYVFWDKLHPTKVMQSVLAQVAMGEMDKFNT